MRFARHAGESKYPNLWKGLRGLWFPGTIHSPTASGAIIDYSGVGAHGTPNGSMTGDDFVLAPPGKDGFAVELDGSNDYVNVGSLVNSTGNATLMAWVYRSNDFGIFLNFVTSTSDYLTIGSDFTNATRFLFSTNASDSSSRITPTDTFPASAWTHITVTKTTSTVLGIFVNTLEVAITTINWWNANTGNYIGQRGGGTPRFFGGRLYDVRLYDRVLTQKEIIDSYRGVSPLTYKRRRREKPAAEFPFKLLPERQLIPTNLRNR